FSEKPPAHSTPIDHDPLRRCSSPLTPKAQRPTTPPQFPISIRVPTSVGDSQFAIPPQRSTPYVDITHPCIRLRPRLRRRPRRRGDEAIDPVALGCRLLSGAHPAAAGARLAGRSVPADR